MAKIPIKLKPGAKLQSETEALTNSTNNPQFVLWRINPKECVYSKINPDGDIFSSKAPGVKKFNLKDGDYLCVVASGANRKKGLLGIWKIIGSQFEVPIPSGQVCYLPPHNEKRKLTQHRVQAKLYKTPIMDNLSIVKTIIPKETKLMTPQLLTREQFTQFLSIV